MVSIKRGSKLQRGQGSIKKGSKLQRGQGSIKKGSKTNSNGNKKNKIVGGGPFSPVHFHHQLDFDLLLCYLGGV
jgi:hypothetical protein